jgi:hypothetical protein
MLGIDNMQDMTSGTSTSTYQGNKNILEGLILKFIIEKKGLLGISEKKPL